MLIAWLVFFFVLGIAVGSFLNVVADRLPVGQSLISPPSRCSVEHCRKRLAARDLIPVFSYLWLRGRCRYCGSKIPQQSLWVELGTGALFAFLYWLYGLSWDLAIAAVYCSLFIVLTVIDFERGILPNKIVYPGIIVALAISIVFSIMKLAGNTTVSDKVIPEILPAFVGGATGFAFFFIVALVFRGGMGWGDVKLAGLIGLVTGFPLIFVAIFLAVVGGGLVSIVLLLLKVKKRKQTIPFGPFLCLAAMATMFWGNDILRWYLILGKFTAG